MTVSIDGNINGMKSSVMEGASALSDKENYILNNNTDAFHAGVNNNENIEDYYELLPDVLGQGRFGIVRECIELETGKKFAVKTLRKRPSNQAVLQAEVQLIKLAQGHDNIVKFVNVFQNDFYMHIITEICHGGRMSDYVVQKFQETTTTTQGTLVGTLFSEEEAAHLIDNMLDAVVYLHERNIVHRDLKLENFLFRSSPTTTTKDSNSCCENYDKTNLTLIDFGLATTYRSDVDEPPTSVVGNPLTIAPEVVLNKEDENCNGYTQACDIWSCGVIAFILLEGRPPFPDDVLCTGEGIVDYFKRGNDDDHNSDDDYYTDETKMSLEAKQFLQCLLQRDPEKRWTAQKAREHPWIQKYVTPTASQN